MNGMDYENKSFTPRIITEEITSEMLKVKVEELLSKSKNEELSADEQKNLQLYRDEYEEKRVEEINLEADRKQAAAERQKEEARLREDTKQKLAAIKASGNKKKKLTPYGNRFLVKRRPIGETISGGLIFVDKSTAERPTDIADVIYVPDHTFADKELLNNAEEIVKTIGAKAKNGDVEALKALIEFNHYIRIKSIRPGATIMLGKYVGTDFTTSEDNRTLTVCQSDEIIAIVTEEA